MPISYRTSRCLFCYYGNQGCSADLVGKLGETKPSTCVQVSDGYTTITATSTSTITTTTATTTATTTTTTTTTVLLVFNQYSGSVLWLSPFRAPSVSGSRIKLPSGEVRFHLDMPSRVVYWRQSRLSCRHVSRLQRCCCLPRQLRRDIPMATGTQTYNRGTYIRQSHRVIRLYGSALVSLTSASASPPSVSVSLRLLFSLLSSLCLHLSPPPSLLSPLPPSASLYPLCLLFIFSILLSFFCLLLSMSPSPSASFSSISSLFRTSSGIPFSISPSISPSIYLSIYPPIHHSPLLFPLLPLPLYWSLSIPLPFCLYLSHTPPFLSTLPHLYSSFKNGSLTREAIRGKHASDDWTEFERLLDETQIGNNGNIGLYYTICEIVPDNVEGCYYFDADDRLLDDFSAAVHVRALVEGQFLARRIHAEDMGFKFGTICQNSMLAVIQNFSVN